MCPERSFVAAVLVCVLGTAAAVRSEEPDERPSPVVLELFTTQGCATCPAADALLSRLGHETDTPARILPLAYHVDYWNGLGWFDPYSQRAWTQRQEAYQRVLKVEQGLYTPQLVVNGAIELVGNQARQVVDAIEDAARVPAVGQIEFDARWKEGARRELAITISAQVDGEVDARKLDVMLALYENGLVTAVGRGENRGKTLRNDFIVRRLESALSLRPGKARRAERQLDWRLDETWKPDQLGLVSFIQDPATLRIINAAALRLPAVPAR